MKNKKKPYVPMQSFLFQNDKLFHSGAEIKSEIERLLGELENDETKVKEFIIVRYMEKKFISNDNPIRPKVNYRVNINKLIFNLPYHDFLDLNMNSNVKIVKDRGNDYRNLHVTDTKYFLDFLKYMRKNNIFFECGFAIIEYLSGEKRLATSHVDFVKWIVLENELKDNFGIFEYVCPEGKMVRSVLVSEDFAYKHEFLSLRENGVEVKVYDKRKRYKY